MSFVLESGAQDELRRAMRRSILSGSEMPWDRVEELIIESMNVRYDYTKFKHSVFVRPCELNRWRYLGAFSLTPKFKDAVCILTAEVKLSKSQIVFYDVEDVINWVKKVHTATTNYFCLEAL